MTDSFENDEGLSANGNQAVNYGAYDIENRLTQAAPAVGSTPLTYAR